jgi:TRAP-type C4-dicarboxylate transport system permease small subunit
MWLTRTVSFVDKVIHQLSRMLNIIGVSILVVMMLLTVADVLLRSFLNRPILGTVELTENLMVALGFLMLAWCARNQGNIRVDLAVGRLPYRVRTSIDSITCFFSLFIFSIITWQGALELGEAWRSGEATNILRTPIYPFYAALVAGSGILCLVLLANLIQLVVQAVRK